MALRSKSYRDKDKLRKTMNAQRKRYYKQTQLYTTKKWTDEEIDLILNSKMPDRELSDYLKRSMQSIQIKRCRLNKKVREGEI